ncbi:MAG TPA: 3D domain-containing protein [Anaerohalosphaeraceae bacterium]|nr:3D domain-containing protein [Phycisphaerae bacterium]HOK95013.1 3D domain-containing protein [Anaerohalosphaeraceae bacterium]HOL30548.1 3D domain-containing protein [Anaerohalosphaeraceae bacterium]HOM75200.1 3D domain-containing protein [Anaerohalosphaeraceae bacterium]HPC64006.1 3D domain-containing protein [Anaerohalosphaeraceae bacterium]
MAQNQGRFYIGSKLMTALAAGLLLAGILPAAWVIPQVLEGDSVVYLQTTLPQTDPDTEDIEQSILPDEPSQISDNELLAMLITAEPSPAYEKPQETEHWQVMRMRVTGYCPCSKCCGQYSDGRTACSHRIRQGDVFVAADKKFPFGTEVIIPGYNAGQPVKVMDRGRAIKGNRIDVFFSSHEQARKWGVKYMDILVKAE